MNLHEPTNSLKGNHEGWSIAVIPSFLAGNQQVTSSMGWGSLEKKGGFQQNVKPGLWASVLAKRKLRKPGEPGKGKGGDDFLNERG